MIENISQLAPLWDVIPRSVTVAAGNGQKILGSDPRRWIVAFQLPAPAIGNTILRPGSPNNPLKWNLTIATDQPLRIDQRDWGPLPSGEWYFDAGGAFTITVVEFIWKG